MTDHEKILLIRKMINTYYECPPDPDDMGSIVQLISDIDDITRFDLYEEELKG